MYSNRSHLIGILGGSFNPPHIGHLQISNYIIKALNLSQLWWLVTPCNPLKSNSNLLSLDTRVNLCRAFVINNKKIKIYDFEKKWNNNQTSYSLARIRNKYSEDPLVIIKMYFGLSAVIKENHTNLCNINNRKSYSNFNLQSLESNHNNCKSKFVWIMGLDCGQHFHTWNNYQSILTSHKVYIIRRETYVGDTFQQLKRLHINISDHLLHNIHFINIKLNKASSTLIRNL